MLTNNELEYRIINMANILAYSNSLLKDSYRMLITNTNGEFKIVHRSRFLRKTQLAFYKLGIIELYKLFANEKKNNQFSFKRIIKLFNNEINGQIISILILEEVEVISKIESLSDLRDKHFAHSDLDVEFDENGKRNIHKIKFYFDDAFRLIEIAEKIIIEMYEKIIGQNNVVITNEEKDAEMFLTNQLDLLNKVARISPCIKP